MPRRMDPGPGFRIHLQRPSLSHRNLSTTSGSPRDAARIRGTYEASSGNAREGPPFSCGGSLSPVDSLLGLPHYFFPAPKPEGVRSL